MWIVLMIVFVVLSALGLIYLVRKIHALSWAQNLAKKHAVIAWLLSACAVAMLGLFLLINAPTMFVIIIHLVIALLLSDIISYLISRMTKKIPSYDRRIYITILFTSIYLGIGSIMAFHVFETHYAVSTSKEMQQNYRIVGFADSHLGITLDGDRFAKQMERIQKLEPDIVVIAGDYVDANSTKEDMLQASRALGELKTTKGIYFISGNHDDDASSNGTYSYYELTEALRENGVTILEDEYQLIDDGFYILGRKDRSDPEREDIGNLTLQIDHDKFILVVDHQPNDYDNEANAGADLVFSGHTHGGHIFPLGPIGVWIGANDRYYGLETREDTTFIVTSGISGWAIPIKTGTFSEFCVIDILSK